MACFSIFPAMNSIPPPCFYNIQGLTNWLNNNPSYKQYFVGVYPNLYNTTKIVGYDIKNVTISPTVTTLSYNQSVLYNQQISIFKKVYSYNSNAYVNYKCSNTPLIYYTFKSYQEKTQYDSAVALINKLYPFDAMAKGPKWIVPFPL